MKTCTKCGEAKPLTEYHRKKARRDGRQARCKTCLLAQQAAYAARTEIKARRAEYNAEYRERPDVKARLAECKADYYAANRETILERRAEYRATRPHMSWVSEYRRRAKKYGFEPVIEPFTKDDLVARWGDACWHCGGPFEQLDHYVTPVALGGHHTLENCRPSCAPCNMAGGNVRSTKTNETENTK